MRGQLKSLRSFYGGDARCGHGPQEGEAHPLLLPSCLGSAPRSVFTTVSSRPPADPRVMVKEAGAGMSLYSGTDGNLTLGYLAWSALPPALASWIVVYFISVPFTPMISVYCAEHLQPSERGLQAPELALSGPAPQLAAPPGLLCASPSGAPPPPPAGCIQTWGLCFINSAKMYPGIFSKELRSRHSHS